LDQPLKILYPVKETHAFQSRDFVAGHPAIDFVNTVTGRNGTPRDWLADADALSSWAFQANILSELEAEQLKALYRAKPAKGYLALASAVKMREAMFLFMGAVVDNEPIPESCLAVIEAAWHRATSTAEVRWKGAQGLSVNRNRIGSSTVADRIALQFVALGSALGSPRLRRCVGNNCGWFFIDTSKAGRRRWCDMATCGNAAKYERFRG
jgi:predicted RNA-binding Zn ribbon-like protein